MIIIGKLGGAPFATLETAIDFKNKYSIVGDFTKYKYGYGVIVESNTVILSKEQIENRLLATVIDGEIVEIQRTGSYKDRVLSPYKEKINRVNTKPINISEKENVNINKITFNDIEFTIHECYKRKDELDDNTVEWLKRLSYVIEKNGSESLYTQTLNRLYGITRRLNINI